jgi:predicted MPP superfamily phosphohydrolase
LRFRTHLAEMGSPMIFLISILLHGYVALRLVPSLGSPIAAGSIAAVLLASALLLPLGLIGRRIRSPGALARVRKALVWPALLAMGWFSSLFVLTVIRDLALLVVAIVDWFAPGTLPADAIGGASAVVVLVAATVVSAIGLRGARRVARVVAVDVPIRELPPALEGFSIVQISDVHVGPTIKAPYVRAIVAAVNRLDADMVAVTGDLVDGSVAELAPEVADLARLSSRHGTFFVTGNHEYYHGAVPWIAELRRLGLRVLMNEHVVIEHHGEPLVVAGVADSSAHHFSPSHRSDPHAAIAGAPARAVMRLLLAHQPRSATAAAEAGFQLQLSGHTHGGQFWPWNLLVRLQQPFTAGLHRLRDLWVYTSRGTGYWGPPKRFGAPSEITRLRLVRAPA